MKTDMSRTKRIEAMLKSEIEALKEFLSTQSAQSLIRAELANKARLDLLSEVPAIYAAEGFAI